MRSPIPAVVLLAGCLGCSPTPNATSSSSASGSSGASGAGSTGASSSSGTSATTGGGTTGGTTGAVHCDTPSGTVTCLEGQSCEAFGGGQTGIQGYQACACDYPFEEVADGGIVYADSCSGDLDGLTVCDPYTLQCRAPRDFEPCNLQEGSSGPACDPDNYACVLFEGPDGGSGGPQLCVQVCDVPTDCTSNETTCVPGELMAQLEDGGVSDLGACNYSACGPSVDYYDGGVGPLGDYFKPCSNRVPNDGTCLPFPTEEGGLVGQCFLNGTAGILSGQCSNGADTPLSELCPPGSWCLLDGLAPGEMAGSLIASAECFAMCNLNRNDPTYDVGCPTDAGGKLACRPVFDTPPTFDADPNPGICLR